MLSANSVFGLLTDDRKGRLIQYDYQSKVFINIIQLMVMGSGLENGNWYVKQI